MNYHDDNTQWWDREADDDEGDVELMTVERCPSCCYNATEATEFDARFCPSEGDRCDGCEVDPTIRRCPDCGHEWKVSNGRTA